MAYKDKEKQRKCSKEWYLQNRQLTIDRSAISTREAKIRNKQFVWDYKTNNPCTDCGNFLHPIVMDFDHISDNKRDNISRMVNQGLSHKTIKIEMSKCELVCANCHRLRTYIRAYGGMVDTAASKAAASA